MLELSKILQERFEGPFASLRQKESNLLLLQKSSAKKWIGEPPEEFVRDLDSQMQKVL